MLLEHTPPIVTPAWLSERIGRPGLVVLDASWYLPVAGRDARAEYLAGHLPGARYFDLDQASDSAASLPHMLPGLSAFEAVARSLGVGQDSTIVVYDGSGTNLSAARAWWMFRVFGHERTSLLDGGSRRWQRERRPIESGPVPNATGDFRARVSPHGVRSLGEVREALARGTAQVVDLRSAGRFSGADPEPRPGISSGHMPGALNLPYADLVGSDGSVLGTDQFRARLAEAGVRLDRPIIATCGSGVSACTLLLALEGIGHRDYSLFDGSWTEWATSGLPVGRGRTNAEKAG